MLPAAQDSVCVINVAQPLGIIVNDILLGLRYDL